MSLVATGAEAMAAVVVIYFPLGVIGTWRWSVWLLRKVLASRYRPVTGSYSAPVSVVTPVYNEDPDVFLAALQSWWTEGVDEIIAVIDHTDTRCQEVFTSFSRLCPIARLIVVHQPGKRPALAEGIQAAREDIVALVDSDTIWTAGVRSAALAPFQDPFVGAVATRQSVLATRTYAQRLFNAQLNLRYLEELPFLTAVGGSVITCLSGRTAFYRRDALLPILQDMVHETFWGRPCVSGEDKRLTYLVQGQGWKVAFQQQAQVLTPGTTKLRDFLRQRLRWTRNSWRADLRTLTQRWVWYHPRFALHLIDRALQPFAVLLSPLFFIVSVLQGLWLPALILVLWWHVSRVIRIYAHLKQQPQDVTLIPLYVCINFFQALLKVYALVTLNRQGWITRWDKSRLPKLRWLSLLPSYATTAVIVLFLTSGVVAYNRTVVSAQELVEGVSTDEYVHLLVDERGVSPAAAGRWPPFTPLFTRYLVQSGDSLPELASRFRLPVVSLVQLNQAWLPSSEQLTPGLVLSIPRRTLPWGPVLTYDSAYHRASPLQIIYDGASNTIEVSGRGQLVTLRRIRESVGDQLLKELTPGVWYLTANLYLKAGVSLQLHQQEVRWLKLASNKDGFIWVRVSGGQLIAYSTKITSWDEGSNDVDRADEDGRSFIAATSGARMDLVGSELAYLGYAPAVSKTVTSSGVAWHQSAPGDLGPPLTGEIRDSALHHNYVGAYVSSAVGMVWQGNEIDKNIRHGLVLAGSSQDILVEHNAVHHNGADGMVLTQGSSRLAVQSNAIFGNVRAGVTINHWASNNRLAGNTVYANREGMVVGYARSNLVQDNRLVQNRRGIRLGAEATDNFILTNMVGGNAQYGVALEEGVSGNVISGNKFRDQKTAVTVGAKAAFPGNSWGHNVLQRNRFDVALQP